MSATEAGMSRQFTGAVQAAAAMLPRRFFFDDMPDKGLFAGIAALGFFLIIALKVGWFGAEAVSVVAVALMFGYGTIAYRISEIRLRLDRLGDNFYYLGFIYTLASLSAALVQVRGGIEVDAILGSFGIALVTTIVGIAGRVVFVQMRSEIDDVEEVIRRNILEASAALKGQLSAALNDLDTFRTGLRQIAEETLKESDDYGKAVDTVRAGLRQVAEETLKESGDYAKAHVHQIAAVAQEAAARIGHAFDERQSQAHDLLKVTLKISTAVDELVQRMQDANLPTEQLAARLRDFTSELESFLVPLGTSVERVVELSLTRSKRRWWWRLRRKSGN